VLRRVPVLGLAGLAALMAVSLVLRSRALDGSLWIDEAISRGIAVHGLTEIPGLLRQDGSPPLYYLLLHGWTAVFGDGETALRSLSLVAALLTVPAALWAGTVVAGRRAGWIAAALAALNPFLTIYAQEARMYALVALFSVLACGSFVRGFVDANGRHRALFALELAALLYLHAWAIFLALGFAVAAAIAMCDRLRTAALPFAAALLLFAPWLPTLVDQARHTGAPWSKTPSLAALLGGFPGALDGGGGAAAVIAVGAFGAIQLRRDPRAGRIALLLLLAAAVALAAAWVHSNVTPSWANRYLAIVVGPVVLVGAAGLARAGRVGVVTAGVVAALWLTFSVAPDRSNARTVAAAAGTLPPGTTVVATQPEQVPLLAYYLGERHSFATPLGPVDDPLVMDWRDALERLRGAAPPPAFEGPVALVLPLGADRGWDAPWQREVLRVTDEWREALLEDHRLVRTVDAPRVEKSRTEVRLLLLERQ
jgi:mannosyltransferase